eukprot:4210738-Prymnesium_polylepis.1
MSAGQRAKTWTGRVENTARKPELSARCTSSASRSAHSASQRDAATAAARVCGMAGTLKSGRCTPPGREPSADEASARAPTPLGIGGRRSFGGGRVGDARYAGSALRCSRKAGSDVSCSSSVRLRLTSRRAEAS